jgi:hypothetical protein
MIFLLSAHFFEDIDTSFRLLPIYRTGYAGQQEHLSLTNTKIVHACNKIVDFWFASDSHIQVYPIQDYVAQVVRRLDGGSGGRRYYNRAVEAAHAWMWATCRICRFYGTCSGYPMGEATPRKAI